MNRRNLDTKAVATRTGNSLKSVLMGLVRFSGALAVTTAVAYGGYRAYGWLSHDPRFAVRHLEFTGLSHAEQEPLVRRADLVAGTNIFSLDLAAATLAMEGDPWVAHARLARELPDTLHVAVTEHEPLAVATLGGTPFVLDAQGVPFKKLEAADHLDLPVLTGFSREEPGNTHAEQVALARAPPGAARGGTLYSTMEPCAHRLSGEDPILYGYTDKKLLAEQARATTPAWLVQYVREFVR